MYHLQAHSSEIDWDGPVVTTEDLRSVSVPSLSPISDTAYSTLQQQLAIRTDNLFGIEHYILTREILSIAI